MIKCIKTVLLGVTGGIAAYKSCYIASRLKKAGINVIAIMTKNATEFVSPLTFETLTGNKVYTETFQEHEFEVEHISLAKQGDLFLVAPATANFIAKANEGIADDMLTTTFLAFEKEKVVAPAMNTAMYKNAATQKNIAELKIKGVDFVDPIDGNLACGDTGVGKMQEPDVICDFVIEKLYEKKDFLNKRVLVTCGGTIEDIDKVRCITNYSSGKTGAYIAANLVERGAIVTLVSGNVSVELPKVHKNIFVRSTDDMYNAVMENLPENDVIIKAAAPCDFKPKKHYDSKIKDKELTIEFVKNPDIAKEVGKVKGDKKLVIFAAETENNLDNAYRKLADKNADMVVFNVVGGKSGGFSSDENSVTIIKRSGELTEVESMQKDKLAAVIVDEVATL